MPNCDKPETRNERLICSTYNRVKKDIDSAAIDLKQQGFDVYNVKKILPNSNATTQKQTSKTSSFAQTEETTPASDDPSNPAMASTEDTAIPETLYEIH